MGTSELDSRNIALSMRKSVENLVISSQDAIGQSISQALSFSGVITQHTNQALQEHRSVSRSPSPLRQISTEPVILEDEENEKEALGSGEGASDTGGYDVPVLRLGDKAGSPPGPKSADGKKKKSWYSSLYPTYKSRSDDFKRLFRDPPDDERLIVDYSCALQKDILAHGRLYASQNYLCFYANIFGWESSLCLRWKDVTAITKEKTALVIPNAILVCTESEKHFFASFSGRDKSYLMLFRVWQNALMDQSMTSQEIWQWVHSCYGEELGFNSDDEGYSRDLDEDKPPTAPEDLFETSSMEAGSAQESRDIVGQSRDTRDSRRDHSPPPLPPDKIERGMYRRSPAEGRGKGREDFTLVLDDGECIELMEEGCEVAADALDMTNGDGGGGDEGHPADTLPTDMSDTSDSEPDKHHNGGEAEKCTCGHEGKLLLRRQFPIGIDQLFTMIFTSSKLYLELLAARNTRDYVQEPWQNNPTSGLKNRQISYTLGLSSGPIGPKEVYVTETQVMNKCSKPGVLYSIDSTSTNAGIPYADHFTVEAHYCLARAGDHATNFHIYGQVRYRKTLWPMIKSFLEKNAIGGLEEYIKLLETRLLAEAEGGAPAKRKGRRRRRATISAQESGVSAVTISPSMLAPRGSVTSRPRDHAATNAWLAGVLLLLLLINGLLYWRLYYAERQPGNFNLDDLQSRMSSLSGAQMADWSKLLERHTHRQRSQLLAWRDALDRAVRHLTQTEQAVSKLLESIKPSLQRAQQEAAESHDRTEL